MREKADEIASCIDNRGFAADEDINLREGLTELGEMYQKGTILYKKYTKGKVPEEAELQDDRHLSRICRRNRVAIRGS